MNNLIILEGCDRTGKSTFARKLEKEGYEYIHFSAPKPDEDVYETYMLFLHNLDPFKKYVVDRFYLGERVYGPIYRGESRLTEKQTRNIEMVINKFDHLMILFTNTEDFIINKFKEDGEDYTNPKDVKLIVNEFFQYFMSSNVMNRDMFQIGEKESLEFLPLKTNITANLEGMGSYYAKYVFVGDTVNDNIRKYDFINAFESGKSSDYLFNEIIKPLGIPLYRIYVTNAYKKFNIFDNKRDLEQEIDSIYPEYVITLGKNAKQMIESLDLGGNSKIINIPHPAFLSRFPKEITKFDLTQLSHELGIK